MLRFSPFDPTTLASISCCSSEYGSSLYQNAHLSRYDAVSKPGEQGMRRREFLGVLGGAATAWPVVARAQQPIGMRRVGILMPYAADDPEFAARASALKDEIRKLGWTDRNIQFDEHWTTDNMDRVRADVKSLIAAKPDVVVATGGRIIPVVLEATRSIPIVNPGAVDPVGTGWVKSLARPGGNITGFTVFEISMFGKVLDTLKRIALTTIRVAMIYNPDNPNSVLYRQTIEAFAGPLSLEPVNFPIHGLADIESAVASVAAQPNSGVFFLPDLTINALRAEVIALMERYRVPAIYSDPIFVKKGGLAYYGTDRIDLYRRAGGYVDRILRGEKPGELPFQQPTKYQLTINLKTAKSLGLELSPTLLATADEVIE
jgi:putative ABC transport system substrate-binding protein